MTPDSFVKLIASASFPVVLAVGGIYLLAHSSITYDFSSYGLLLIILSFVAYIIEIAAFVAVKELEYEPDNS